MSIFKIVFLICFLLGSVIRGIYTKRNKGNVIADDFETTIDKILVSSVSLGLFFLPFLYIFTSLFEFADYDSPKWLGWVGTGVFPAALWLLWRSHVDLGRNWLPTLQTREEHTLVTQGVFRLIRHPMYTAHVLWGIAQILLLHNWIAGPSMLIFSLPVYVYRIPREEQMMLNQFGEKYREYMDRTGRIFPLFRK